MLVFGFSYLLSVFSQLFHSESICIVGEDFTLEFYEYA